jgi:hypothetical protein
MRCKVENKREYRTLPGAELRTKPDGKGITGYAALFNSLSHDLGGFVERIKPGAFARCLGSNPDVRCLFNHNPNIVLGRSKSGTLLLEEDERGLKFDVTLPATQAARDLYASIERGDIDGASFGFAVNSQTWLDEKDAAGNRCQVRELNDVDLFDAGPVTAVAARALWPDGEPQDVTDHREKKAEVPPPVDYTETAMRLLELKKRQ